MDKVKLDDGLLEDLAMDLLPIIEKQFDFKFNDDELLEVKTFDDLVSIVIQNINLDRNDTCTSQQAFYKIRRAAIETELFNSDKLAPSTYLEDIFPKKNRLANVSQFKNNLGFDIKILAPNEGIVLLLSALLLASFATIFFNLILGLTGLLVSVFSLKMIHRFSRNIKYKTIGELINSNLCENYISFRRDTNTINETELKKVLIDWFSDSLFIEKNELNHISFQ